VRAACLYPKFVLHLSLASLELNLMDDVETLLGVLGGNESLRQLVENLDGQDRWRAPTATTNLTSSTWVRALVPTADKMMNFRPLNIGVFADDVNCCLDMARHFAGRRGIVSGKGPVFGSGKDICIVKEYCKPPPGPGATWLITSNTKGSAGYDLWCEFKVDDDAMMEGAMYFGETPVVDSSSGSSNIGYPRFRREVTLERLRAYALYAKNVHPLRVLQVTILCACVRNAVYVEDADLVLAIEVLEKSMRVQGICGTFGLFLREGKEGKGCECKESVTGLVYF